MELTEQQIARIDRGATLLDQKVPDWYQRVVASNLDINSFSRCVLCYACGGFWSGLDSIGLESSGDMAQASEHGFYPHKEDDYYDTKDKSIKLAQAKTRYWLEHVAKRIKAENSYGA